MKRPHTHTRPHKTERIRSRFRRMHDHQGKDPEAPATSFGVEMRVELEEIAYFLQRSQKKGVYWDSFLGPSKKTIHKDSELLKLLYGLSFATIKSRSNKAKSPPKEPLKRMVLELGDVIWKDMEQRKVSGGKASWILSKERYEDYFHTYLYNLGDILRKEEGKEIPVKL